MSPLLCSRQTWLVGVGLVLAALVAGAAAREISFGMIEYQDGRSVAVEWESDGAPELREDGALRLEATAAASTELQSGELRLAPFRMVTIGITGARGPGTEVRFDVRFRHADGTEGRRHLAWQLASDPRPSWLGIAPYPCAYTQCVVLPRDIESSWLEVEVKAREETGFNYLLIHDLRIREGDAVAAGQARGPNLLSAGGMELMGSHGLPVGWDRWQPAPPALELREYEQAETTQERGTHYLRIPPGHRFYLPSTPVPVEFGRAYEISFLSRGTGDLTVMAHPLASRPYRPLPLRVGDPQASRLSIDTPQWQRFELMWFAEALHVQQAQVLFVVAPKGELYLDAVELREVKGRGSAVTMERAE